jgi:hypothetical protein
VIPAEGTFKLSVPIVPPPESPLLVAVVTPVMVPAPGKVCPEINVTLPVWSILKAVPLIASVESVLLGNQVSVLGRGSGKGIIGPKSQQGSLQGFRIPTALHFRGFGKGSDLRLPRPWVKIGSAISIFPSRVYQ